MLTSEILNEYLYTDSSCSHLWENIIWAASFIVGQSSLWIRIITNLFQVIYTISKFIIMMAASDRYRLIFFNRSQTSRAQLFRTIFLILTGKSVHRIGYLCQANYFKWLFGGFSGENHCLLEVYYVFRNWTYRISSSCVRCVT